MNIIQKSKIWEKSPFDSKTRNKVRELKKNPDLLYDSFYKNLEFGTGGIRGIMGVGTNRVNKYTIGKTTQGLAKYLLKSFKNDNIKVVLAYDCRNNGVLYSKVVSNVLSANGIICYVFRDIRPTPQLSFAIKELNAQCGIMLTASHNPPEYNGYKVYWSDGGQIVPPIDKNLIEIINSTKYEEINFKSEKKYIKKISKNFDNKFIEASTKSVKFKVLNQENLKITFSSLHGTSIKILPDLMKKEGFKNFNIVDIESQPDGNFGKLSSPNPEDPKSFKESLKLANKTDSDIVIVTDPDADRLGIAIRNNNKKFNSSKKKVGIHFRRYKVMTDILPPMPWVYYEYALKKFDSEKYEFFCFSDDIDDVKKNFDVKKFNFLENNNELDDLYCLSQCDSVIMSNSTFSWWGAWLNNNPDKICIRPSNINPSNNKNFWPDDWVSI